MDRIVTTIAVAVGMFAATNIDDAVVLTVLNVAFQSSGAPKQWEIWAGQFVGIGLIVLVSLLAALGLSMVPVHWVGLLGLFPLIRGGAIAITSFRLLRAGAQDSPVLATGLFSVVAVTFSNGGDNIALYTPAFRIMGFADTALTVAVFAAATALWCLGAALLISRKKLVDLLRQYSRWIVPAVMILLGVYILARSGVLGGLADVADRR
ncbi:MAG: cadmium transporter [Mycobacterium sp.]|jgi:cadmium resistance protein CadD (predicted permease)|nr:cadmium transporter [Mycobacterium sp.]